MEASSGNLCAMLGGTHKSKGCQLKHAQDTGEEEDGWISGSKGALDPGSKRISESSQIKYKQVQQYKCLSLGQFK